MEYNEIIKALEYCSNPNNTCEKCVLYVADDDSCECASKLRLAALDLINRQKAEIERLNRDYSIAIEMISNSIRTSRTEAVKEFAERLSEKAPHITEERFLILQNEIDNLVKEMVGERR